MDILLERRDPYLVAHKAAKLTALKTALTYRKQVTLQGQDRVIAIRQRRPTVISQEVACWVADDLNLWTYLGYQDIVLKTLRQLNLNPVLSYAEKNDHAAKFEEHPELLTDVLTLRDDQLEVIKMLKTYDRFRVTCPTGWGKSYMLSGLALYYPKATIDIVVPGKTLLNQLHTDLSRHVPLVGMVGGGKNNPQDVTVVSVDSLHKRPGDVDLLVVDECHTVGTSKRLEALARYKGPKAIGLSASNDKRADNADFEIRGLLGPIRKVVSYQQSVAAGSVVPIEVVWVRGATDATAGGSRRVEELPDSIFERVAVWRNKERNRRIGMVARLIHPQMQTLITVKTFEHLVFLKDLLPDYEVAFAPNPAYAKRLLDLQQSFGVCPGWTLPDEKELATLKQRFEAGEARKAIATTVWNVGVNFRRLSVLIRADASAAEIASTQIPGRLSRKFESEDGITKTVGRLIDFQDTIPRLRGRYEKRAKEYRAHKWVQRDWASVAKELKDPKVVLT